MSKPFDPEQVVGPGLAERLITDQFPELGAIRVEPMGAGWDNTVYRVSSEVAPASPWVFRFPRRQVATSLLRTEASVLPYLAERLPLTIPFPQLRGTPAQAYPWEFLGHREISGITGCQVELAPAEAKETAVALSRFLSRLHATDSGEARRWGAPGDDLGRLDLTRRLQRAEVALQELTRTQLELDLSFARPILDETIASAGTLQPAFYGTPECRGDHLIHGDLYARHLLFDGTRSLCGVIDWGDLHLGHPSTDLSIAYTLFSGVSRAAFFETYGEIPGTWHALARFRALYHTCSVTYYAAEVNDEALLRVGIRSLERMSQA